MKCFSEYQQVRVVHTARTCVFFSLLLMMLIVTGCVGNNLPMPDLANAKPGDLVITFTGKAESWMFVQFSRLPRHEQLPPYSHAEFLLKDPNGQWLIAGVAGSKVRCVPLQNVLHQFTQLAVIRPYPDDDQAQERFVDKARQWLDTPSIRKAEFIYTFEDVPGRTDGFFCVSFINELHRQCALPVPMPAYDPPVSRLMMHLNRVGHLPAQRKINSPITLFDLPSHRLITQWTNPDADAQQIALNHALVNIISQWYDQGWELSPCHDANLLLKFSDFPDELHEAARLRISLRVFAREVNMCWDRLRRRGQLDEKMPDANSAQIQSICLKYRERHFRMGNGTRESAVVRLPVRAENP